MELYLLRHGKTKGNEQDLYVGRIDQPLTERGIEEAQQRTQANALPQVDRVYVSPLLRARQTASILLPQAEHIVVDNLIEMDFGDFEGKHDSELRNNPHYVAWIAAERIPGCPNGESEMDFDARVQSALSEIINNAFAANEDQLVVISHGGVGMTIMVDFARPKLPFYRWRLPNCGGFRIKLTHTDWEKGHFTSWDAFGHEL